MPSSAAVRAIRIAISPRLAMSSRLNMGRPRLRLTGLRTLEELRDSAAIDDQVVRIDEAALIAGQEYRGVGNVVRDAGARQGRCPRQIAGQFGQFSRVILGTQGLRLRRSSPENGCGYCAR